MSVIRFKTDAGQDISFYLPSLGATRALIEESFQSISEDLVDITVKDDLIQDRIVDLLNLLDIELVESKED
jgi:hypothetical protein